MSRAPFHRVTPCATNASLFSSSLLSLLSLLTAVCYHMIKDQWLYIIIIIITCTTITLLFSCIVLTSLLCTLLYYIIVITTSTSIIIIICTTTILLLSCIDIVLTKGFHGVRFLSEATRRNLLPQRSKKFLIIISSLRSLVISRWQMCDFCGEVVNKDISMANKWKLSQKHSFLFQMKMKVNRDIAIANKWTLFQKHSFLFQMKMKVNRDIAIANRWTYLSLRSRQREMGADPAELFQLQMFLMPVMIVMTMMVVMLLLTYQTFPRCVWAAFKKEEHWMWRGK